MHVGEKNEHEKLETLGAEKTEHARKTDENKWQKKSQFKPRLTEL